jgi:hypothetical protein
MTNSPRYDRLRALRERKAQSVRIPADLMAEVEQYAEERGVSLNAALVELIGLGLDSLDDGFDDDDGDDGDDEPSETVVRVPR